MGGCVTRQVVESASGMAFNTLRKPTAPVAVATNIAACGAQIAAGKPAASSQSLVVLTPTKVSPGKRLRSKGPPSMADLDLVSPGKKLFALKAETQFVVSSIVNQHPLQAT